MEDGWGSLIVTEEISNFIPNDDEESTIVSHKFSLIEYYSALYAAQKVEFNSKDVKRFQELVKKLERLRHPHIIQFVGVLIESKKAIPSWFIFERLELTLHDLLLSETKLEIVQVLDICKQICLGLIFLHSQNISHGRLICSNILIGRGFVIKLSDVMQHQIHQLSIGQSDDVRPITEDIFDLGLLIVQLCNHFPAVDEVPIDLLDKLLQQHPCFTYLLTHCLAADPSKRLTAIECKTVIEQLITFYSSPQSLSTTAKRRRRSTVDEPASKRVVAT